MGAADPAGLIRTGVLGLGVISYDKQIIHS